LLEEGSQEDSHTRFFSTRSHEGSKAQIFLFHAKLAKEQRNKE